METEPQAAESRRKIAGYELFVRHDGRAVTEFRSAVPEHTRVLCICHIRQVIRWQSPRLSCTHSSPSDWVSVGGGGTGGFQSGIEPAQEEPHMARAQVHCSGAIARSQRCAVPGTTARMNARAERGQARHQRRRGTRGTSGDRRTGHDRRRTARRHSRRPFSVAAHYSTP